MTLAVVQSRSSTFGINTGPSTVAMASAPTAGNLLLAVVVQSQGNGAPAPSAGWTLGGSFTPGNANNSVYYAVYYRYATGTEGTSLQPQSAGLTYAGMTIWEISGVSGVFATDKVAITYENNTAAASTNFTDSGLTTTNANELVLAMIAGGNSIGYGLATVMTKVGAGTLTPDDHVAATGGLDGSSIVAGHYTLVANAGTVLQESTSTVQLSHWGAIWVELQSTGSGNASGALGSGLTIGAMTATASGAAAGNASGALGSGLTIGNMTAQAFANVGMKASKLVAFGAVGRADASLAMTKAIGAAVTGPADADAIAVKVVAYAVLGPPPPRRPTHVRVNMHPVNITG